MSLAEQVLPLVRNRADLHRWRASNAYGHDLYEAVEILEEAADTQPASEVLTVTQKAIASACKVIMRADDSSGIIGGAIQDLLTLHVRLACLAHPPAAKLVAWMIRFQFDNECDFFTIDPGGYGPALGEKGMAAYRANLDDIAASLRPEPTPEEERASWQNQRIGSAQWERAASDRYTRFLLEWNARRLAVFDRDIDAIIATHSRDRKVAAWLEDAAEALAEIGEFDLAIDWAKQATDFNDGHQSVKAAEYWCTLLAEHQPDTELDARLEVFRRWPTAIHAGRLHTRAGDAWPSYAGEVMATLEQAPREAVAFALHSLDDVPLAWQLAHSLSLDSSDLWESVATRYEKIDPLAVLPIYSEQVESTLERADARSYRWAARRLAHMRALVRGCPEATVVDQLIADLRETHRRRPRLQQEFDRAGLP